MYRIVDHNLTLDDLTVKEGRKGGFFSLEEVKEADCAFNCREIVIAYFNMFHSTNVSSVNKIRNTPSGKLVPETN